MTRFLLILPALSLVGASPPQPVAPQVRPTHVFSPVPSHCAPLGSIANGPAATPQLRRLGELPGAQAYMAVHRTDEKGCLNPMLASERQRIRQR